MIRVIFVNALKKDIKRQFIKKKGYNKKNGNTKI